MPVSPATATVREAFTPDDQTPPVAEGESGRQVAGVEPGGRSRTRRIALVGACLLAFALGFAGVTVLTRGSGNASSPRTKPTQPAPAAGAPAAPASSPAKAPTSAPTPPSSALVGAVGNDQAPVAQSSPLADAADRERGFPDAAHDHVGAVHDRAHDHTEHYDALTRTQRWRRESNARATTPGDQPRAHERAKRSATCAESCPSPCRRTPHPCPSPFRACP